MDTPNREELLDRLMHQALEEKLGSVKPCDVSDKLPIAEPARSAQPASRTWFRLSVAAAALVVAVFVYLNNDKVAQLSSGYSAREAEDAKDAKYERAAAKRATTDSAGDMSSRLDGQSVDEMLSGQGQPPAEPSFPEPPADDLVPDDPLAWDGSKASEAHRSNEFSGAPAKAPPRIRPSAADAPALPGAEVLPSEGNKGKYAEATTEPAPQSESTAESPSAKPAEAAADQARADLDSVLNDVNDRLKTPTEGHNGLGSGKSSNRDIGDREKPRWAKLDRQSDRELLDRWAGGKSRTLPFGAEYDDSRNGIIDEGGRVRSDEGPRVTHPDTGEGRDRFARLNDNRFLAATENPLSTFSIDVDTASYSVVRSRIDNRVLPPPAAVRVEELVNYFSYSYPQPTDGAPFAVHVDVAACPWAVKHRLVRIGLKGKEIAKSDRPASNLVFLVDVSGSMQPQNKLPLVKHGLLRLVGELDERDRVAIVVYAGSSGCVLASTPCTQANKERIRSAIGALESGGSTNGEAGIQLAYQIAQDHFVKSGANRVILCTDGDFNVGTTGDDALKQLVADRAKSGVFLTALGFGMGNHNDQMLEAIADNGNGTYGYIDDQREVEKLFVRDLSGTLITIAKDVKIQVEFNPAQVGAYRLIGYENRILAKEDFNNDKKDAGDIGAGHTVTALYEIVPPAALAEASKANAAASEGVNGDATGKAGNVDSLEFQRPKQELELTDAAKTSGDLLLVKLRYKAPDGDTSTLIKTPAKDNGATFAAASSDFKFAASVAAFGMILRQSPFRGDITLAAVEEIAGANRGEDQNNQRREFVNLVQQLRALTGEEGRGARD